VSRTDARSTSLRRRPARTVPATITAVVLLALGVGLVWAAVQRLARGSWPGFADQTATWLAALTWGNVWVLILSIGVAVLGLVLLVAAIKPGPPTAMAVDSGSSDDASTEVVMTRRSVAKLATARAGQVDGVDSVSSVVGARKVTVTVKTPSQQRSEIEQQVRDRVTGALLSAGLAPMPAVVVRARTQSL
jgi:uncharacterized protein DUF6286